MSGKTALVTGANSGIGYEIASALYLAGAHVIIASRDKDKGLKALHTIQGNSSADSLEFMGLELSSLADIKRFSHDLLRTHKKLDLLVNNAGVMAPPATKTTDGFELQFGVNFLGHFALTGYLYPILQQVGDARVVTLSSGAHRLVKAIDFDNLKMETSYEADREYAISKLANLQYVIELHRRVGQAGHSIISVAAHPGVTATSLSRHMDATSYQIAIARFGELMPAWQGALPALYAATAAEVVGGGYYGPDGKHELSGYPAPALISDEAMNAKQAAQLWNFASITTGITYP